jgi:hypothetical protein
MDRTSRCDPPFPCSSVTLTSTASTIDRILIAYGLPTDLRSLNLASRDRESFGKSTASSARLITLLDFLGAMRLAEYERKKRDRMMIGVGMISSSMARF